MNTNIYYAEKPLQSGKNPWWVVRYQANGVANKKAFWRIEEAWQFYDKFMQKSKLAR